MKQYRIDELRYQDYEKIKSYLDENFGPPQLGDVYWIPVLEDMLNDIQREHTKCQPFYFAIELTPEVMACELLVRTKNRLRCNCIKYATEKQRNWFISFVDSIFERFDIMT